MSSYEHIFFDLDHTLWDFSANCAETLQELHAEHQLSRLGIEVENFITTYRKVNDGMWHDFHHGRIDKETIRTQRFIQTFALLGLATQDVPEKLDEQFIAICPTKKNLFPHTLDVLDYLAAKYPLHIITNGFSETQHIKMSSSGLTPYFQNLIHSDLSGHLKPDVRMFQFSLDHVGALAHHSIMIGDDLFADVLGAKHAGIDQVFINRHTEQHDENITHEITCLSDLKIIL